MPQLVEQPIPKIIEGDLGQNGLDVVLVNRNHDAYQMVIGVQQNHFGGQNNILNMAEQILAKMVLPLVFIYQILFLLCLSMCCILNSQWAGKSLTSLSLHVILVNLLSNILLDIN